MVCVVMEYEAAEKSCGEKYIENAVNIHVRRELGENTRRGTYIDEIYIYNKKKKVKKIETCIGTHSLIYLLLCYTALHDVLSYRGSVGTVPS